MDKAKGDVLSVLAEEGESSDDELHVRLGGKHSTDALQGALTDLTLRDKVDVRVGKCPACPKPHAQLPARRVGADCESSPDERPDARARLPAVYWDPPDTADRHARGHTNEHRHSRHDVHGGPQSSK